MSFKVILAPVTGNEAHGDALQIAVQLVQRFQGSLVGLHSRPDPRTMIPYIGDGMTSDIIKDLIDAAETEGTTQATAARKMFADACAAQGVPMDSTAQPGAQWRSEIGLAEEITAAAARLADLTVASRPAGKDTADTLGILDGVLLLSGKPVLLVPPATRSLVGETIVIAWNGSAEGARAVTFALPFLTAAKRVVIVGIGARDDIGSEPSALAGYLSHYGVTTEQREVPKSVEAAGPALMTLAADMRADMIVMGAYTHTRLRQIIFGGVTRHLLENTDVPTLMCH